MINGQRLVGEKMEHIRFPIGKFTPTHHPTAEQRNEWIEEISQIVKSLRFKVQHLSSEQLSTPYRPGGWTIQQIIHHMVDNDMNAYIRFKRALTEDTPTASSYREDLWADGNDYRISIEPTLNLLDLLHSRFVYLLRSLSVKEFDKTFISPSHGVMSLEVAIERFTWHSRHHIAQIESLIERLGWKNE
ncbi:putative metal-dependent hydrolase [Bacillus spongiae]|uniref:Metal-dependent hydrolase n=1 Tax=Bacillus spongiae TaxID=2683610 RepID=A0ABU8HD50_9BACI